ncbi:hypothetical protein E0H73_01035 [Kribbella pittospori]|uniref:Uncharacterized protein n=1 Tax=Kribbella pittospori TaxID=722689 RepID=A0A4R0L188_9ACTN|nr:hypothetical protein [Kribbella pittospori]TCC65556.1 hypothetical protein E0H73_01035 [Kribbella pittospori]
MSGPGNNAVENPHAGKGSSVLLDIGGDIGALVIDMPADLEDEEVELRKAGSDHDHHHDHDHDHGHGDGHGHGHGVAPHVAVVPRPKPDGTMAHSAVFSEVAQGTYELYLRPHGPVQLTVEIHGGQVTEATWPS